MRIIVNMQLKSIGTTIKRRGVLLGLALLCLGPLASAEPGPDEAGRLLVEQMYTVAGGAPVKDLVIELEDHAAAGGANPTLISKTKLFFKSPSRLRADLLKVAPKSPTDGQLTVVIRDGQNLWVYGGGPYPAKSTADTPSPSLALPYNLQTYRRDSEREFFDLGPEMLDGVKVRRVQILSPSQPNWTAVLWIDPVRRIPLQLEIGVPEKDGKTKKKKVVYKDIRQLPDGRYFPFQIHVYENDVFKDLKIYKGVRVNVGLDSQLFEPVQELIRRPK